MKLNDKLTRNSNMESFTSVYNVGTVVVKTEGWLQMMKFSAKIMIFWKILVVSGFVIYTDQHLQIITSWWTQEY